MSGTSSPFTSPNREAVDGPPSVAERRPRERGSGALVRQDGPRRAPVADCDVLVPVPVEVVRRQRVGVVGRVPDLPALPERPAVPARVEPHPGTGPVAQHDVESPVAVQVREGHGAGGRLFRAHRVSRDPGASSPSPSWRAGHPAPRGTQRSNRRSDHAPRTAPRAPPWRAESGAPVPSSSAPMECATPAPQSPSRSPAAPRDGAARRRGLVDVETLARQVRSSLAAVGGRDETSATGTTEQFLGLHILPGATQGDR